jgi:RimJ/RimL family protein N-acetyltransferase
MITLETERLVIRNFIPGDWEALYEMITQYAASENAAYDQQWPTTPEEIKGVTDWFAGGDSFLAVCLKDAGQFIGFVSLNPEEKQGVYNIGYIFNARFHRQGYATEACRAALEHVFDTLQAESVITGTAAVNRASCRLLERLGFQKTEEKTGSFKNDPDGKPIEFLGYTYYLPREAWQG